MPGNHGARGEFDDRASASSPQLWASMNRNWLTIAGAGLSGIAVGFFYRRYGTAHSRQESEREFSC